MKNLTMLRKKLTKKLPGNSVLIEKSEDGSDVLVCRMPAVTVRARENRERCFLNIEYDDRTYLKDCTFEAARQLIVGMHEGTVKITTIDNILIRLDGWNFTVKEHNTVKQIICLVVALLLIVPSVFAAFLFAFGRVMGDGWDFYITVLFLSIAGFGVPILLYGIRQRETFGNLVVRLISCLFMGFSLTMMPVGFLVAADEQRKLDSDDVGVTILFGFIFLVGLFMFIGALFYQRKKEDDESHPVLMRLAVLPPHDDVLKLIAAVRARTERDCIAVSRDDRTPALTESKLGGVPYWEADLPVPVDENGKAAVMLVQINFAELPKNDYFPRSGILQIFTSEEEFYNLGWNLSDETWITTVYHSEVNGSFTQDDVKKLFPVTTLDFAKESETRVPLSGEQAIGFYMLRACCFTPEATEILHEEAERLYIKLDKTILYEELFLSREDCIAGGIYDVENFMLGNSVSIDGEEYIRFLTLNSDENMCWNDGGRAEFVISRKALLEKEFDKVRMFAYSDY